MQPDSIRQYYKNIFKNITTYTWLVIIRNKKPRVVICLITAMRRIGVLGNLHTDNVQNLHHILLFYSLSFFSSFNIHKPSIFILNTGKHGPHKNHAKWKGAISFQGKTVPR